MAKEVIFIVGSSGGIGLSILEYLSNKGYQIIATMRESKKNKNIKRELECKIKDIDIQYMDVLDKEGVHNVVEYIKHKYERIDIIINNVGYLQFGCFEDQSEEQIKNQMEVNFFSIQNILRKVLPIMRLKKRGMIINMSSISGIYSSGGMGAYQCSKWALESFSESLSYELNQFNIKVYLIEPGPYPTNIYKDNRKYGITTHNKDSIYYNLSKRLLDRSDKDLKKNKKNVKDIAKLCFFIIKNRPNKFRFHPDNQARVIYYLRKFLPYNIFYYIVKKHTLDFKGSN